MVGGTVPLILGQGGKMLMLLNQSEERADLGAKTRKLSSGGVQGMVPRDNMPRMGCKSVRSSSGRPSRLIHYIDVTSGLGLVNDCLLLTDTFRLLYKFLQTH